MASLRPGHEFWKLDTNDAKAVHKAVADVLRWYSIPATQKAIDHVALAILIWQLDTPRIVYESRARKLKRQGGAPQTTQGAASGLAAAAAASAKIFRFTPADTTPAAVVPEIGEAST